MQLVGMLEENGKLTSHLSGRTGGRRNCFEKGRQILGAFRLERTWSKEQILEAYVNGVSFRGDFVGIRVASQGFFGKAPGFLDPLESALLVAQIRAPNADVRQNALRACRLLQFSEDTDSCLQIQKIATSTLNKNFLPSRNRNLVPVWSHDIFNHSEISKMKGAENLPTTLDIHLQTEVMVLLREQLHNLRNRHVEDAAALILDARSGEVLVYAANAGRGVASKEYIDGIKMRRQAGSTLKPFLYATAFEMGLLNAQSLLEDSPDDISLGNGLVYQPHNYDRTFRGDVGVGEALASSLNVPAVKVFKMVGEERFLETLGKLGIQNLKSGNFYGPSLALGSLDVSLWELTQGYRRIIHGDSVFSSDTIKAIYSILSTPEYRRLTFGFNSVLNLPFSAAVKTGTSKDMRDNWCLGGNKNYIVGVWVGNFSGEPMWNVSGVSGAAPLWQAIMKLAEAHRPRKKTGEDPEQNFLTATPTRPLSAPSISFIRYPVEDMFVGLDPDIPIKNQSVFIDIVHPQKGHRVYLDGHLLGNATNPLSWTPHRGEHQIKLLGAQGEEIDQINFKVR